MEIKTKQSLHFKTLLLFYLGVSSFVLLFQWFDNAFLRGSARLLYLVVISLYLYRIIGLRGLKKHWLLVSGVFFNAAVSGLYGLFERAGLTLLAAFLILLTKVLIGIQLYSYPNRRREQLFKIHYFLIPLIITLLFDWFFLVDELPASAIAVVILSSAISPLLVSLTLFLSAALAQTKWYFLAGLILMGFIDHWEIYFHFINGVHKTLNILAVLNLLPMLLIYYGFSLFSSKNEATF